MMSFSFQLAIYDVLTFVTLKTVIFLSYPIAIYDVFTFVPLQTVMFLADI